MVVNSSVVEVPENPPGGEESVLSRDRAHHTVKAPSSILQELYSVSQFVIERPTLLFGPVPFFYNKAGFLVAVHIRTDIGNGVFPIDRLALDLCPILT